MYRSTPLPALLMALFSTITPVKTAVAAMDLVEVFEQATFEDPEFKRVAAAKRAIMEQRPQALSGMLPLVRLSAASVSNNQDISLDSRIGTGGKIEFNSHNYGFDLNQPLVRYDRFVRFQQAGNNIKQAEAELFAAQQDLMLRTSQAYFTVLGSLDALEFSEAEVRSLTRQLEQTRQRFDVGLTAITDVHEAQAGYDRATADRIAAENAIEDAREALREITGEYYDALAPLGDGMQLVKPVPEDIDSWSTTALEHNLSILASQYAVDSARDEVRAQFAGHLPTLDLVARQGYDKSGGRFGGTKVHTTAVGLELNVPLFQSGFVTSRTREASHRVDESLQRLEFARRRANRETREAYLGVVSGISQVYAFKQALVSTETALEATQAGFDVGTRTAVDVVAAERLTQQARRDYARARYTYILDTVRLKRSAGILTEQDLNLINAWLN